MPGTLLERIEANRAKRHQPPRIVRLYPSKPTTLSPFVRAAREKSLRPKTFVAGAFVPSGSDVTA
jgi:hypothetical protein